jgi:hypothetical protein
MNNRTRTIHLGLAQLELRIYQARLSAGHVHKAGESMRRALTHMKKAAQVRGTLCVLRDTVDGPDQPLAIVPQGAWKEWGGVFSSI